MPLMRKRANFASIDANREAARCGREGGSPDAGAVAQPRFPDRVGRFTNRPYSTPGQPVEELEPSTGRLVGVPKGVRRRSLGT
jgi:hypothetical protein